MYERVSTVLDIDAGRFIVTREGPTRCRSSSSSTARAEAADEQRGLHAGSHQWHRALHGRAARRLQVPVTVNLPPNYQTGTKLPALFWFYPREFQDQDAYDQPDRTFNKNTFATFGTRSMEFFTRLGYAVVENDSPIVGPQGQMNNNYVNDLRNNLSAMIDELDRRALVDRTRLAIGGHSYGAFSTVNAMVHTPFFKAGIAGDGAYNRTLTPLGFQSERRDLWEAPNVYLTMSPFL